MPNPKATKDDLLNLIKGKPTKNKVGSRNVPHRLNKYELVAFKNAISKKYLKYSNKTRLALINSFDEYQLATNKYSLKLLKDNYKIELVSFETKLIQDLSKKIQNAKIVNDNYLVVQATIENYPKYLEQILKELTA
jgi:predicted GIY-YIG superfamily endonuclease